MHGIRCSGIEDFRWKHLSEKHDIWFENTVTHFTFRHLYPTLQLFPDMFHSVPLIAVQTFDPLHITMQLENPVRGISGLLVEIVDILCDDTIKPVHLFQFGYCEVCPVWSEI